jgi:hypothetical protein
MLTHQPPAVVVGCHKIGLGIIRALGTAGVDVVAVHYGDMDMAHVSCYVRRRSFPASGIGSLSIQGAPAEIGEGYWQGYSESK